MNVLSISWWRNISQKMGRSVGWGCMVIFGIPLVIGFGGWGWSQYNNRGANTPQAAEGDILTVNGEPVTQKDFLLAESHFRSAAAGEEYASAQGQMIYLLVEQKLIAQMAKAVKVRPSEADIDREVATDREATVGAKGTLSEWENYLEERHLTVDEFRQQTSDRLLGKALQDYYKAQEKVTPEEAKNQSAEIQMNLVMIPAIAPPNPNMMMPPNPKAMTDADAKKKAEDLLAKVQAGADIAKIAKENSADGSAKDGGDTKLMPEFGENSGLMFYGKEFGDAVHKTQKGQFTPVVKMSGFQNGYAFARVTDRRNNLPKDYDEKKVIETLQTARSKEKLSNELQANDKAAKIVFAKGQDDKKAYYDYFKFKLMERQMQMAMFGQPAGNAPTAPEVEAQKVLADTEIEGVYQRHAKDSSTDASTSALLIAADLKSKLPRTPAAEQPKVQDRLITLYETALKTTEDRQMRLDLAGLYRDKKDLDKAEAQYKKVATQLKESPPFDLDTIRDAMKAHQDLYQGFKSLDTPIAPRPTAAEAAQKEQEAIQKLQPRMLQEQIKAAEEERKNKAAQPGAGQSLTFPGITPSPGGAPATGAPSTSAPAPTAPAPGGTPAGATPGAGKGPQPNGTSKPGPGQPGKSK